jgi:hypothetical protein
LATLIDLNSLSIDDCNLSSFLASKLDTVSVSKTTTLLNSVVLSPQANYTDRAIAAGQRS